MSGVLEIIRTSASGGSDLRIYAFILKWMDVLVGWGGGGGAGELCMSVSTWTVDAISRGMKGFWWQLRFNCGCTERGKLKFHLYFISRDKGINSPFQYERVNDAWMEYWRNFIFVLFIYPTLTDFGCDCALSIRMQRFSVISYETTKRFALQALIFDRA